ncbi:unnamed protein product [Cercopithifilaria johnstoni]|uniref:Uncharacterized protein n=1 Tax=Cercopithifilaria johnstoni TaxID=2874296 RepID=A0A8J2M821_9BILA|nr:unnamed protein product [Cercopithifilaria johnstoni]
MKASQDVFVLSSQRLGKYPNDTYTVRMKGGFSPRYFLEGVRSDTPKTLRFSRFGDLSGELCALLGCPELCSVQDSQANEVIGYKMAVYHIALFLEDVLVHKRERRLENNNIQRFVER